MINHAALAQSLQTAMQTLLIRKGVSPRDACLVTVNLEDETPAIFIGFNKSKAEERFAEAGEEQTKNIKSGNPGRPQDEFRKKWGISVDGSGTTHFSPFYKSEAPMSWQEKRLQAKEKTPIFSSIGTEFNLIPCMHPHDAFVLRHEKRDGGVAIKLSSHTDYEIPKWHLLTLAINESVLKPAGIAPIDPKLVGLTEEDTTQILQAIDKGVCAKKEFALRQTEEMAARRAEATARKAAEDAAAETQRAAFDALLITEAGEKAAKLPSVGAKTEDLAASGYPITAASEEEAEAAAFSAMEAFETPATQKGKPTPSPLSSAIARVLEGRNGQNNGSLPGL